MPYIVAPQTAPSTGGEAAPAQSRAGQCPPLPGCDAVPDAPQDRVGPPGSRALPAHVQLVIDQDPQVPFHGTALQPLIPQSVCTSRVAPSASLQVQDPALSLVEHHTVGDCPAL